MAPRLFAKQYSDELLVYLLMFTGGIAASVRDEGDDHSPPKIVLAVGASPLRRLDRNADELAGLALEPSPVELALEELHPPAIRSHATHPRRSASHISVASGGQGEVCRRACSGGV